MELKADFDEIERREQEEFALSSRDEIKYAFERALHATDDTSTALKRTRQYAYRSLGMMCRIGIDGATFARPGDAYGVRMSQGVQNAFVYEVVRL